MIFSFTCEHCGSQFVRNKERSRFCSARCDGESRIKVDSQKLRALAPLGLKAVMLARALGVSSKTLRSALRREGLYRAWAGRRYAKCEA